MLNIFIFADIREEIPLRNLTIIEVFTYFPKFLMRENDVTTSNVIEMKTDVIKRILAVICCRIDHGRLPLPL